MNSKNNNSQNQSGIKLNNGLLLFDLCVALSIIFSLIYGLVAQKVEINKTVEFYISFIISPVCMALAILIFTKRVKVNVFNSVLLNKPKTKHVVAVLLIAVGLLFGLSEVNEIFCNFLYNLFGYTPTPIVLPEKSTLNVILTVITIAIIPPVFEEFVFRGVILYSFNYCSATKKIILTGAIFALFHMSPMQTVYQFIVGCIYALIIVKSKNLLLTVGAHIFNNLFIVLNEYFFNLAFTGAIKVVSIILGIVALIAGLIILLSEKTENDTKGEKGQKYLSLGVIICIIVWVANLLVGAV